MKKLLFISMMIFAFSLANAQIVIVKDTTFINDSRLNFMKNTVLPAATDFVNQYNRQAKIAGDSITFKAETRAVLNKIEKAINDYSLKFMVVSDKTVNVGEIETELTRLNNKITTLQADQEYKIIEESPEYKRMIKRRTELLSYYNQIPK